jgi:hypothetical protein
MNPLNFCSGEAKRSMSTPELATVVNATVAALQPDTSAVREKSSSLGELAAVEKEQTQLVGGKFFTYSM